MTLSSPDLIQALSQHLASADWEAIINKLMLARYIRTIRHIATFLPPHARVLDFGCGQGQNTFLLHQFGFHVTGLELISHPTWSSIPADFVVYSGYSPPFTSHTFDAVIMFGVLEHVGPDTKSPGAKAFARNQSARLLCLEHLHQLLRPEGHLFIYNFPHPHSPIEIANQLFNFSTIHQGSEKQTLHQLTSLVNSANFDIIESGRTGTLPASIGFMFPTLRDRFVNRHYLTLDKLDNFLDNHLGDYLGQSNYLIAQKLSPQLITNNLTLPWL